MKSESVLKFLTEESFYVSIHKDIDTDIENVIHGIPENTPETLEFRETRLVKQRSL
jgi:hypothetical protein